VRHALPITDRILKYNNLSCEKGVSPTHSGQFDYVLARQSSIDNHERRTGVRLIQDGLGLAAGAVISAETSAQTGGVVAQPTSGAVAPFVCTLPAHNVGVRRALAERAVRAAGSDVTQATLVHDLIPRSVVGLAGKASQFVLGNASPASGAIVGAHGALAGIASVTREALASTSLAITGPLTRALGTGVGLVVVSSDAHPRFADGASAQRAVSSSPRGVVVRSGGKEAVEIFLAIAILGVVILLCVTDALVVRATSPVAGAAVRAVRVGDSEERHDNEGGANHDAWRGGMP
jgi:hypothetical protein